MWKIQIKVFWIPVELHLDDILEVLLVVGFKFIFYKIEIDKYYWKIYWKITMIT